MTDLALPPESAPVCAAHPARLKLLVLAHVLAGPALAMAILTLPDLRYLSPFWLRDSIWISQVMLLSFWLGMAGGHFSVRLVVTVLGCAFLAIWQVLPDFERENSAYRILGYFLLEFVPGTIWSAIFLVMRKFKFELRPAPTLPSADAPSASQFSILQILFVTSIVAIVLSLSLAAHAESRSGDSQWASWVLTIVTYSVNLLCAVWATLSMGRVRWRLCLVLLTSLVLNIIANWPSNIQVLGWWRFVDFVVATTTPTLIVAASLLVVRSCGYRLLPKRGDLPAQQGA